MEHTCANMEGDCSSWVLPSCFVVPVAGYVMGETVKVPVKNFLCSFEDCDATFNKSWKLQAHMCKHTGEVRVAVRSPLNHLSIRLVGLESQETRSRPCVTRRY